MSVSGQYSLEHVLGSSPEATVWRARCTRPVDRPVALKHLKTRGAEETARVTAAAAGVELRLDVPEQGLTVHGDAQRLGQACDNLVSNAVKFTPAGGSVTLTLRAAW